MKVQDKIKMFTGKLSLTALDNSGAVLWRDNGKNLIVTTGYKALTECLTGNAAAQISHVEIGTNIKDPHPDDTAITDAVKIEIQKTEHTSTGVTFGFTIALDVAVGMSVCEFGLITKDGRLFSRRIRMPIEKTDIMSIVGEWSINFY